MVTDPKETQAATEPAADPLPQEDTVVGATYKILRHHGATTIFGNPGSNELPFIAHLPSDFRYIQCLHEGVAVSMAEGYAQSSGGPVMLNLHSNSGTGNGMGMLANAHYSHSPLIIIGGQQVREIVGYEPMLANPDATTLTKPLTKWSYEPLDYADVPRTLSNAVLQATTEPQGPTFMSIPWDDWSRPCKNDDKLLLRKVHTAGRMCPDDVKQLGCRMDHWKKPLLILGPDVDAARAQEHAVRLAERLGAIVWVAPSASRCPFPTTHANYKGVLHPSQLAVRQAMEGFDGVLIVGAPIFRYHSYEPDHYVPDAGIDAVHITCDPHEAARAPFADSIVASIGPALEALSHAVHNRKITMPPRVIPPPITVEGEITGPQYLDVIAEFACPTITYVNEVTSLSDAFMERVPITHPDGYKLCASGGLGFGIASAVGVSIARPNDTVVATIGDGSTNYHIQALYTAARLKTRTVFVIMNNGVYGAVIHFAEAQGTTTAPGLRIPGIDFLSLAKGYGVPASRTDNLDEFRQLFAKALKADGPVLIEAKMAFT